MSLPRGVKACGCGARKDEQGRCTARPSCSDFKTIRQHEIEERRRAKEQKTAEYHQSIWYSPNRR